MTSIEEFRFQELLRALDSWVHTHVLSFDNAIQLGLVALALLLGRWLGVRVRARALAALERRSWRAELQDTASRIAGIAPAASMLLLLWLAAEGSAQTELLGHQVTRTAASLVTAWVVIRLASRAIRNEVVAGFVAWFVWGMAALVAVGLFDAAVGLLDGLALHLGEVRISLLMVLQGAVALAVLLWATVFVSNLLEQRIERTTGLSPSARVLTGKLVKIVLVAIAFLLVIHGLGIDLTALAVFGGALGLGVGIGLQKVVANLMTGILLLMDKSIKPNDVIAVNGTYGWVTSLGGRYVSVRTRDGTEHLIPNEELITQRVENWSHSDRVVRLKIPIGVSYRSDLRRAIEVCQQAVRDVDRVLAEPPPSCLVTGFGDSAVDLELRIWIDDPQAGRANVISDVLLKVWDGFHANRIEIPFPQRDLHLKSSAVPLATSPVPTEA
jgi:small-conductance mechanosensitive channel